jgi:hypothetical protein
VSGERGLVAKVVLLCALAAALASAVAGSASGDAAMPQPVRDHGRGHWYERACLAPVSRDAACGAQVVSSDVGVPLASPSPPVGALGPADFHAAYALPTTATSGTPTIAIVDAFDDPNIESDLAAYDTQYGLPACTSTNGCFTKVDQNGGTSFSSNTSWHLEIALDVETVHQMCQNCKILLVEASTNSFTNLDAAVNEAAALGANVISNSYGGSEYSLETTDTTYNHPGVVITASTGDSGYGVEYPAASPYVVAVGGTSLHLNADRTWASEGVWSGAGSGCSAYAAKPAWQADSGCSKRAVADVSADADPNTGAAIYDSIGASGGNAWYQVGGTSLSAPLIGAVYALAGSTGVANPASVPYAHAGSLHDIASGSNGSCSPSYLCTGGSGYDGPTGVGTPNGLGGFTAGAPAPDFTLGASPSSQTVAQGGTASYTVTLSPQNGFSNSVGLSVGGLPAGATGGFSPTSVGGAGSPTSTLTVNAPAGTPGGTYTLTITGTSGALTRTATTSLTVQPPPPPPVSLSASPAAVNAGGTVTVAWANVSGPTRNNWVGLYTPGAANSAYLGGFYDDDCGQTAGTTSLAAGSCSFKMPTTGGTYEFRLFASKATTLIWTSNAVTVTVVDANPTLSTSATANVAPGGSAKDTATLAGGSSPTGTITFRVYGPSDSNCTAAPVATSTASVHGNGGYSSASFTPTQAGTYRWIASYGGDGNNNAAAGACGDAGESTVVTAPTLGVSTSSTARGSAVTVSWSGVGTPVNTDWIGVFTPGASNSSRLSWLYDATCSQRARGAGKASGSCSFTMPGTAGTYEFRLFSGSNGALLATSSPVAAT